METPYEIYKAIERREDSQKNLCEIIHTRDTLRDVISKLHHAMDMISIAKVWRKTAAQSKHCESMFGEVHDFVCDMELFLEDIDNLDGFDDEHEPKEDPK